MKTILSAVIALSLLSCASTKSVVQPVGEWNYKITGTPNGDYSGLFIVIRDGDNYSATLTASGNKIVFNEVKYASDTRKLTGYFYYDGNRIDFASTTEGDAMNGSVSAGGDSWPFKATR